jgi:hypothetical protein
MFRPPLSLWEENGVLRTCPLKRSGGLVTSKLAVNLLVADALAVVFVLDEETPKVPIVPKADIGRAL